MTVLHSNTRNRIAFNVRNVFILLTYTTTRGRRPFHERHPRRQDLCHEQRAIRQCYRRGT